MLTTPRSRGPSRRSPRRAPPGRWAPPGAGLLGFQRGDVDGARVVGVEELAPFGVGLGELAGQEHAPGGVAVLAGGDLGFQFVA